MKSSFSLFRRNKNKSTHKLPIKKRSSGEKTMGREVAMLIIGAVISLLSTGLATWLSERKAEHKEIVANKMQLNQDLSRDIGARYYLTYDILSRKITVDSTLGSDTVTLRNQVNELMRSRMAWNEKINSYKALLAYYYGPETRSNFIDSIYNPFITLGNFAADKKMYTGNANMADQCYRLNSNIQAFMEKIYVKALSAK
jgi:hypothetical protein